MIFYSLQQLLKNLIHHARICFSFHGFHCLTNQEPDCFLLSIVIIFHRLRIVPDNLFNYGSQLPFIIYSLPSLFLPLYLSGSIFVFKDFFKHFFGNGTVNSSCFCQLDQFRQISGENVISSGSISFSFNNLIVSTISQLETFFGYCRYA